MKKVHALVLLSLLLTALSASAGVVSPGLERQMASMADDDQLVVLVVLKEQADVRAMNWELHDAKATRAQRHAAVVDALQSVAKTTQGALLADLSAKAASGQVRAFRPYWLINGVRVATTVAGARELAARGDVEVVEADLKPELIEPLASEKVVDKSAAGIGITPGVVAVGARRVWDELGIDGTGVLVGILDTGVAGDHPALSARWRGNFAPASECWFDAIGDGSTTPTDGHYHGTHVMGTITGLAADDTIGVAPGALWIASNVINQGVSSEFDPDVVNSLQFMTDPDGNPATTDDVPDVVQNSWGINESFGGDYIDCDSRWWAAIDACEAAGVVLTWSAGNEGSGSQTLRSPADRATDAYNAFSVGSTLNTAPYTISSFSSRGPSGCGGAYATKPEVVAPGSDIYSAQPGGGYQYLSGTSMAGPHVAGVVALMRGANPDLDVITIKEILMQTATDLGPAGEENDYGHGMVNAYEAVLAVMTGFGAVDGVVTDATSGLPIAGAAVLATAAGESSRSAVTAGDGSFGFSLPQGTWTLDFSAFGYVDASQSVVVVEDATTSADQMLTAAPSAVLSGIVYDDQSQPLGGATVTAVGTPVAPATTDGTGAYSLTLPTGTTYDVLAQAYGFGSDQASVAFNGATTQDFTLPALIYENFESGGFNTFNWTQGGTLPWVIDTAESFEGATSARSGAIDHSQTSTLSLTLDVLAASPVEFEYKVSSESGYDYLRFYVDGVQQGEWSGVVDWSHFSANVGSGLHTLTWSYEKDGSVDSGSDAAWIDFVILPTVAPPAYPDIAVTPSQLAATLDPGASTQLTLTVANTGEADLVWNAVGAGNPLPSAAAYESVELPKGEADTRPGRSPLLGAGGPDGYGYNWIDSNEVGGPVYDWVDISGLGTPQSFGDDSNQTFALPFTFNFYGVDHTTVNVCSNGFLSFTSTSTAYSNAGIPSSGVPNDMIAVLWDDLNPNSAGTIYTYADAANGRFIVQWDGVPYYSSTTYLTFQVILNADGSIVCQYADVADRGEGTFGIENPAGDDGLEVAFNTAYAVNGLAVAYATEPLPEPWLTLSPSSGVIPAGQTGEIIVTLDATDLAEGVYSGSVTIGSNDPDESSIIVPVTLTVTTVSAVGDLPVRFALDAAYPNPFNPQTKISFAVPAGGERVTLDVFDVSGRLIKRLVSGELEAGNHAAVWSGDDRDGRRVASGTYFYRLQAGDFVQTRSMVLVK